MQLPCNATSWILVHSSYVYTLTYGYHNLPGVDGTWVTQTLHKNRCVYISLFLEVGPGRSVTQTHLRVDSYWISVYFFIHTHLLQTFSGLCTATHWHECEHQHELMEERADTCVACNTVIYTSKRRYTLVG